MERFTIAVCISSSGAMLGVSVSRLGIGIAEAVCMYS
jgi:hypothetical protein